MATRVLLLSVITLVSTNDTYTFRMQQDCSTYWTIHGLWPNWQLFCEAPVFNVTLLTPIRSSLDRWWKSCFNHTNEWLWNHEWTKHGSCSGMDQLTYFSTALNMLGNYSNQCYNHTGDSRCDNHAGDSILFNKECSLCFDRNLRQVNASQCHISQCHISQCHVTHQRQVSSLRLHNLKLMTLGLKILLGRNNTYELN